MALNALSCAKAGCSHNMVPIQVLAARFKKNTQMLPELMYADTENVVLNKSNVTPTNPFIRVFTVEVNYKRHTECHQNVATHH